ncbi:hypothetical protein HPB49_013712 [Dermacentor silvarum]|uniref:Uncharacterized protein n=1 Tax=Dermacentor silvarum TaxID=543639 RepID=A0ACB8D5U2_DERSI|nr:hypothetical protein HPB49_013712 [Dermacentor silvarum]
MDRSVLSRYECRVGNMPVPMFSSVQRASVLKVERVGEASETGRRSRGPQNRVRFEEPAGPVKQGATWADRVRSGGRPAEKVTGGAGTEHDSSEIAQLRKENAEMRSIIESMRAEIAELRKANQPHSVPVSSSTPSRTPSPQLADVPIVVEASHPGNPARRKAVPSMPENVQAKAKSEIREMLNSICFEIQKINERLSAVDQRLLVVGQKIDAQNVKIQCLGNRMPEIEPKVQEMDISSSTRIRPVFLPDVIAPFAPAVAALLDSFEQAFLNTTDLNVGKALDEARTKEESQFLDVGCGSGSFTKKHLLPRLPPSCKRLVAVDNSDAMLKFAGENRADPRIEYRKLDIVAGRGLSHADHRHALKNVETLLAPGGECFLLFSAGCLTVFDVFMAMMESPRWKKYSNTLKTPKPPKEWKSTPQSKVKATILTAMGETGLRLPVNADAMPAIQQLRRENPNQTALPTRHTNENHDSHHFPSDYKIVFRPRDGLDFSKWQSHRVARAVRQAAHITATESDALTLRIRNEQNLAVASTPKEELAERIRRITTLQLGGKEYQVYAYVAAPDMSCKGVATGIDSETHPDELMANLRSPQAPILFARMLGKSTAALITFDGLEVPRTIYYYGGELLCRPYRPLSQVCSICLKTGHRADICPTPESARRKNCGHENPSEDHQCQPKCVLCEGDHPVTDPSCPARQRKPFNKSHFLRNAGYTSDANNVPTTTNPGTSTNQPKTPGSKSPPASTETNVDRGRSPRRSTDSKKRDKSRDASASRSQSLPRTKTPRHERHEAATNEQGAESRSTIDMLEKSERKALTKGPGTNPPKILLRVIPETRFLEDIGSLRLYLVNLVRATNLAPLACEVFRATVNIGLSREAALDLYTIFNPIYQLLIEDEKAELRKFTEDSEDLSSVAGDRSMSSSW